MNTYTWQKPTLLYNSSPNLKSDQTSPTKHRSSQATTTMSHKCILGDSCPDPNICSYGKNFGIITEREGLDRREKIRSSIKWSRPDVNQNQNQENLKNNRWMAPSMNSVDKLKDKEYIPPKPVYYPPPTDMNRVVNRPDYVNKRITHRVSEPIKYTSRTITNDNIYTPPLTKSVADEQLKGTRWPSTVKSKSQTELSSYSKSLSKSKSRQSKENREPLTAINDNTKIKKQSSMSINQKSNSQVQVNLCEYHNDDSKQNTTTHIKSQKWLVPEPNKLEQQIKNQQNINNLNRPSESFKSPSENFRAKYYKHGDRPLLFPAPVVNSPRSPKYYPPQPEQMFTAKSTKNAEIPVWYRDDSSTCDPISRDPIHIFRRNLTENELDIHKKVMEELSKMVFV